MYPGILAEQCPDRAALVMARSGERVTYGELDARSNQVAHLFRDAGLERGDSVALFMENNPRYLEYVWAALRSGLYITAVNSYLSAPEAAYIINDCGAKVLLTSAAKCEIAAEFNDEIPNVKRRLMVDGTIDGYDSYEDAITEFPETKIDDESLGIWMLYSSGTTGRPKGILRPLPDLTPWDETPQRKRIFDRYSYYDGMVYLNPAPLYHAAPLTFVVIAQRIGATIVVMEKFHPEEALALIDKHQVTHSQWVPTMFSRMLKLPQDHRDRYQLSSHKVAIHAAAPCPVEVKKSMIDWWGPILYEYYAGTEGNGSTFIDSEDWLKHPGSVGQASNAVIHILDEDGNELPPGQEGGVYFSGQTEFEYKGAPEKTAESRAPGGKSTLGDVGYVDEDGYLYLTDRKTYMIISGGVNIYPQEIEDALIAHEAVLDVAVFGVPNDDMGEEVKAVVQLMPHNEGTKELEKVLIEYCRERIAHYKCPHSVDFIDELPRLPTGKLYKRLLRDKYWGKHDSRIV